MAMFTLKGARSNARISQREMAEKLGISTNAYNRHENTDEMVFNVEQAFTFSEAVGIPMDDIMFFIPNYTKRVQKQKEMRVQA